jgi:ribosomal protein S21
MSENKEPKKPSDVILPENIPIDYLFEKMLKTFMKQVDKSGILQEVRARRYYVKPSMIKRLAAKAKRRRQ